MDPSNQLREPSQGERAASAVLLSVRLLAAGEDGVDSWRSSAPAAGLASDLIAASEGATVSNQGDTLVASFPSIPAAIFTARRLQWAVQGLAEAREWQGASLVALVHSPEDLAQETVGPAVQQAFEKAAPGQILLTAQTSLSFADLPGFPTRELETSGLRELLWRSPEEQSTRSFDEQLLTQILEQQGLTAHPAEPMELPGEADADRAIEPDSAGWMQALAGIMQGRSRYWVGGGCAAAVLLAVVLLLGHGKPKPATVEPTLPVAPLEVPSNPPSPQSPVKPEAMPPVPAIAAPPPPAAVDKTAAPDKTVAVDKAAAEKQKRDKKPLAQREAIAVVPPPKPPEPAKEKPGRCDLESSQIPAAMDRADRSFGSGKYSAALRQFGEVVECEPGNGRAREGLERVKRAIAAEGGHDD